MSKRIVSIRLEEELWEKLRDLAGDEERTVATQIHYMLRRFIEQKEQNQVIAEKRAQTREKKRLETQKRLEELKQKQQES